MHDLCGEDLASCAADAALLAVSGVAPDALPSATRELQLLQSGVVDELVALVKRIGAENAAALEAALAAVRAAATAARARSEQETSELLEAAETLERQARAAVAPDAFPGLATRCHTLQHASPASPRLPVYAKRVFCSLLLVQARAGTDERAGLVSSHEAREAAMRAQLEAAAQRS